MRKMFFNKKYNYYVAYCFNTKNNKSGFGYITISNSKKLSLNTIEDIQELETFIQDKNKAENVEDIQNIVIMDWRRIK